MVPPPTERRRPAVPVTFDALREAGLRYLGRYDASVSKLKSVLVKRARTMASRLPEAESPDSHTVAEWVDQILSRFVQAGLVNDERFSERLAESLRRRGLGRRAIVGRLRARGIEAEVASQAIARADEGCLDSELLAAQRLVKRRKLGHLRSPERRGECANRDLGALARAGFSWEVARRALEGQQL